MSAEKSEHVIRAPESPFRPEMRKRFHDILMSYVDGSKRRRVEIPRTSVELIRNTSMMGLIDYYKEKSGDTHSVNAVRFGVREWKRILKENEQRVVLVLGEPRDQ